MIGKPQELSFEAAACIPEAGHIALAAFNGLEQTLAGQRVLVNGAAGGAGTFVVQYAKSLGAEVTAIDHGDKLDLLNDLGVSDSLDFRTTGVDLPENRFDAIIDIVGTRSAGEWLRRLTSNGVYRTSGGTLRYLLSTLARGTLERARSMKRLQVLAVQPNQNDLGRVAHLVTTGVVQPIISSTIPLDRVATSLGELGMGRTRGKVAVVFDETEV